MKLLVSTSSLLLLPHSPLISSFAPPIGRTVTTYNLRHQIKRPLLFTIGREDSDEPQVISSQPPSKRAAKKAAERAKKAKQEAQGNKSSSSMHPEAILKRQQQKGHKRKHNFSNRQNLLSTDDDIASPLDRSSLTLSIRNRNVKSHDLHSENVQKLDDNTSAEEVVKAIKRAQNLHDLHDVVEIAHFLIEEVGESEN
jgi:hypothetical protein